LTLGGADDRGEPERQRGCLRAAEFTRLDVKDGRLRNEKYRAPFADIISVPEFEYGTRERLGESGPAP
jgi:hypothetical protein